MYKNLIFSFSLLVGWLFCSCTQQPKVGLAISGGGAKGAAAIGVIQAFEEEGIQIDYVAGTSIGAVIGGLYSSGYTSEELLPEFRKLRLNSVIKASAVEQKLREMLERKSVVSFKDTSIPFICVAADLETGEEVDLSEGVMCRSIRASMAIPGVFPYVFLRGKKLVDGALVNNLPVDVARKMGADIVIAIDLQQSSDDYGDLAVEEFFGIAKSWSNPNAFKQRHIENSDDADIYIHVDLTGYTFASFGNNECNEMFELGKTEAKRHLNNIKQLIAN